MIHRISKRKFSRRSAHRTSLLRNLCKSLINSEQILTTLPKAKSLRSVVEKLITTGKENDLNSRRKLISKLGGSLKETDKILNVLSPRYKERNGGYTRVIKAGYRKGDCAPIAIIQFVN
ncbi:MAG: 50S ribosomal protein L17 [Rickettsiales bacterium]|jgi:large subunit ribosomal protein L17|uniref:50S ribosomal protein L17 n=1 Tax=Candidatus Bandiella numerosa TaxID=2570586 RepID=UPI001EFF958F|nr:50S ribosomal protein L17 [Candidatus Bandiella numerosa]MBY0580329.1 50S ribosomal protein L17 [Rickettsiales bacterium]